MFVLACPSPASCRLCVTPRDGHLLVDGAYVNNLPGNSRQLICGIVTDPVQNWSAWSYVTI